VLRIGRRGPPPISCDFQYRWSGSSPSESGECYLQLRDLKRKPNETTFVSLLIDYQSEQAESTRDIITIMYPKDEDAGPTLKENGILPMTDTSLTKKHISAGIPLVIRILCLAILVCVPPLS
jgi:hypothetical protein